MAATADRTKDFALKVVSGEIIAGDSMRLAAERFLKDLERQGTEGFPYYWNPEKANLLIEFAELLIIAEGQEKTPLVLYPFQAFIFGNLNGWVNEAGFRRFRTSYVQLGRQQGKSLFNAVLSLFYGNFDGYQFPQCYCVATKQSQAWIVAKECEKFISADEELQEVFTVKTWASKILCHQSNGEIKALGKDSKSIDGLRPYLASIDEYHAHPDDQMYKLMQTGTKKMDESLISVITTSGFNLNSPCFKLYEYCKQIIAGAVTDETQFVFIAELDANDDPYDESNWQKANPLWDNTTMESMRTFAVKAKLMGGSEEMEFFTKALNMWVDFNESAYIAAKDWKECGSERTLEDFKGKPCYAGLDLSSGGDLTSLSLVFPYSDEGVRKYYVYSHSFMPSNRLIEHEKSDKAPYRIWVRNNLMTVTETLGGIKTDYKYIIAHINELVDRYELDLKMICYDPHNASAFLYDLEILGFPTMVITQSARNLSDATNDFALEVKAGNVEYDESNQLLTWSVVNAKTVKNSFGEVKIDKNSQEQRIDPVDSIIDAWKMAMQSDIIDSDIITETYLVQQGW